MLLNFADRNYKYILFFLLLFPTNNVWKYQLQSNEDILSYKEMKIY